MTQPEKIRILAVEDNARWLWTLDTDLSDAGLDHETAQDADTAIERLRSGEFSGVITDGLDGDWERVVEAAQAAGAASVLMTTDLAAISTAKEAGIAAFDKGGYLPETLQKMVHIIVAEQQTPS